MKQRLKKASDNGGGAFIAVTIAIILVFFGLAGRILYLQTTNHEEYRKQVVSQMTTESVIPAERGDI